jgi:2'-5' RNA ligase
MKRLFFALWPDRKLRSKLAGIIRSLDATELKPVRAANIHVTLVFLGAVEEVNVAPIKQQAAEISGKPFSIVFDQLHYWRKPKVLCLGSSDLPPEIINLAEALKRMTSDFGIETDKRKYLAHATLARKVRKKIELDFEPVIWRADSFCLVESVTDSYGPQYKVMQTWSLGKR